MFNIFQAFFKDLLNAMVNQYLTAFEVMVGSLFRSAFMLETLPGIDSAVLSVVVVQHAFNVIYGFMVLLLALKLLWKGFKVYILWRDGEAETPPGEMVIGAVFGMIIAVAFPVLYEIAVSVAMEISDALLSVLSVGGSTNSGNWLTNVISNFKVLPDASDPTFVLLTVIFLVILIVLIGKLLLQGAELLIWRLGVPLAVIGLVDSDGGAWKPYIQMLFRELATLLVQYFCIILGTHLIAGHTTTGVSMGIAFEILAFNAPKLLSQFMIPSGGGGGFSQKLSTAAMVIRVFRG